MRACARVCIIVHNCHTQLSMTYSLPSEPPEEYHSSNAVHWRERGGFFSWHTSSWKVAVQTTWWQFGLVVTVLHTSIKLCYMSPVI